MSTALLLLSHNPGKAVTKTLCLYIVPSHIEMTSQGGYKTQEEVSNVAIFYCNVQKSSRNSLVIFWL